MSSCNHTVTQGRKGEGGSWCVSCGIKVYEVETRDCSGCIHYSRIVGGSVCRKYLMVVVPSMLVTFAIECGTCWESAK